MPGYKHSDVGVIPDDWDAVPLSQTAKRITRGASPRPIDSPVWFDSRSSVGWVRISDVTRSGRYLTETTQRLSEEGIRRSRPVPSGSLIMSICATVGRPIETRIDTCIHDGFVVFDQPSIDQSYLYHVLAALETTWSKHGQTGSQMNLNTGLINSCLIPLPPTETEQRAIAQALSDVDALLAALDKIIAKKRDLKQATMQRLLTGKTRLPGFSGEWRIRRLGEEATFHKGKGLPKSHITPFGSEPCIHYGELFTQYPEIIKEVFSSTDKQGAYFRSIASDVLMPTSDVTPRGLAKASCIQMDGVILGGDILVIRTDPSRVYGPFLSYVIRREEAQVLRLVTGTTVFHLYGADMKKFLFQLPPIDEQRAIACVLSDMDAELSALEARREKTRQLKQAMMQELLTGKTRLI